MKEQLSTHSEVEKSKNRLILTGATATTIAIGTLPIFGHSEFLLQEIQILAGFWTTHLIGEATYCLNTWRKENQNLPFLRRKKRKNGDPQVLVTFNPDGTINHIEDDAQKLTTKIKSVIRR